MRQIIVSTLLVALAFAGCTSQESTPEAPPVDPPRILDELSRAIHEILPVEEVWIDMDDGKAMHTAVYRPDTNETVPVFINFSPYWGDTAELGGDPFGHYMINEYVPRGYAVVLAALRGTGHSEGCFQIGGDREVRDMYHVIDHFATQPWSNGKIASGGKSYDSSPTNGVIAKMPHPALRGVFHVSGITDMYEYNHINGVPYQQGPIFNTYYYLQGTDEYGLSFLSVPSPQGLMSEDAESLARVIDDVACTELPRMQASGVGSGVTGLKDDYWIERDWARYVADTDWNGSIFFVHGLQDWNVKPDHILPWLEELPEQIRVKSWLHQWTQGNTGHVYPMRTDWNRTMLAWLDSELKGKDTGFWDGPDFDVQGTDMQWRHADAWPPAPVDMPLGDVRPINGPGESGHVIKVPLQGLGNETGHVRLTGTFKLTFDATSASEDPFFTAALFVDGVWQGEAVLRGVYRNGLEMPSPITPGVPVSYTLESYPFDVIAWEASDVEIHTQVDAREALTPPTHLTAGIPDGDTYVLEMALADATARGDQPVPMECFAC